MTVTGKQHSQAVASTIQTASLTHAGRQTSPGYTDTSRHGLRVHRTQRRRHYHDHYPVDFSILRPQRGCDSHRRHDCSLPQRQTRPQLNRRHSQFPRNDNRASRPGGACPPDRHLPQPGESPPPSTSRTPSAQPAQRRRDASASLQTGSPLTHRHQPFPPGASSSSSSSSSSSALTTAARPTTHQHHHAHRPPPTLRHHNHHRHRIPVPGTSTGADLALTGQNSSRRHSQHARRVTPRSSHDRSLSPLPPAPRVQPKLKFKLIHIPNPGSTYPENDNNNNNNNDPASTLPHLSHHLFHHDHHLLIIIRRRLLLPSGTRRAAGDPAHLAARDRRRRRRRDGTLAVGGADDRRGAGEG